MFGVFWLRLMSVVHVVYSSEASFHSERVSSLYRVFSFLSATFNNHEQIKYNAQSTQASLKCLTRWYIFRLYVSDSMKNNEVLKKESEIPRYLPGQLVAMLSSCQATTALLAIWLKTQKSQHYVNAILL